MHFYIIHLFLIRLYILNVSIHKKFISQAYTKVLQKSIWCLCPLVKQLIYLLFALNILVAVKCNSSGENNVQVYTWKPLFL